MSNKTLAIIVRILAGALLLMSIGGGGTEGYYQIMRVLVLSSSIYLIWYFTSVKLNAIGWTFLIPAILFNPIAPLHFSVLAWSIFDVIFSIWFFASLGADEKWKINWSDTADKEGVSGMVAGLVIFVIIGITSSLLGMG